MADKQDVAVSIWINSFGEPMTVYMHPEDATELMEKYLNSTIEEKITISGMWTRSGKMKLYRMITSFENIEAINVEEDVE